MSVLSDEIAAYDALKADLEAECFGRWVLIHDRSVVHTYATFDQAARDAVSRFGRGPYLIRQIGAAAVNLPASVMYRPAHAQDSGGL